MDFESDDQSSKELMHSRTNKTQNKSHFKRNIDGSSMFGGTTIHGRESLLSDRSDFTEAENPFQSYLISMV